MNSRKKRHASATLILNTNVKNFSSCLHIVWASPKSYRPANGLILFLKISSGEDFDNICPLPVFNCLEHQKKSFSYFYSIFMLAKSKISLHVYISCELFRSRTDLPMVSFFSLRSPLIKIAIIFSHYLFLTVSCTSINTFLLLLLYPHAHKLKTLFTF